MSNPKEQSTYFQGLTPNQLQNIALAMVQHQRMLQAIEQQRSFSLVLKQQQKAMLTSQMELMSEPMTELMKATGIPFTRKNYMEIMGLTEPLDAELEAKVPKGLK